MLLSPLIILRIRSVTGPVIERVWLWHFDAGLFCLTLIVLLSVMGGLYLFRPVSPLPVIEAPA